MTHVAAVPGSSMIERWQRYRVKRPPSSTQRDFGGASHQYRHSAEANSMT